MSHYRLVRYDEKDHQAVAWFRHRVIGSTLSQESALLRWRYLDNPYYHEPPIYLAKAGDQVIGMRGVHGARWEADRADPTTILVAANMVTDPAFREGSLYRDLNEFAFADLAANGQDRLLSLSPTDEAYLAAVMTMGWKGIGSVGRLIKSDRPMPPGRPNPRSGGKGRARLVDMARRLPGVMQIVRWSRKRAPFSVFDRQYSTSSGPRDLTISDMPDAARMVGLVERIGTDGRIRHVRDATYLSWRYRKPGSSYRFLYWGRNTLEGYLVLSKSLRKGPAGIVDWEAVSLDVADALLDAVVRSSAFSQLSIWAASLPPLAIDLLRTAGFDDPSVNGTSRYADRIIVRSLKDGDPRGPLGISGRRLDRISDWDLRAVYSSAS